MIETGHVRAAGKGRAEALLELPRSVASSLNRATDRGVLRLSSRFPAIYSSSENTSTPVALCATAPASPDLYPARRYLCGQDPERQIRRLIYPVEQPMKFEFIVNLQSGEADRPDDPTERAGARGPSS